MDTEDIVQVNTCFGRGIIGFILKKFLEKKFGIEFEEFTIPELKIHTYGASTSYKFDIEIIGMIPKGAVSKIVKGED